MHRRGPLRLTSERPRPASLPATAWFLLVGLFSTSWKLDTGLRELEDLCCQIRKAPRPPDGGEPVQAHRIDLRLDRARQKQIVADYLAGATSRALAARYSVSKGTIIELVRAAGYQPRGRGPVPKSK